MRTYRYVTLDPTGNITCLVLDPPAGEDEAALTRELLRECEQVAYLEPPRFPGAIARIRLMGGEFCGNAAMASAAWLVREEMAPGEEKRLLLEVSGTAEPVACTVRRLEEGFQGTVEMPPVQEIREETFGGLPLTLARMDGIVHLIYEGETLEAEAAEALLREIAGQLPDEAVGLLQWNRKTGSMRPLVYVRGSGSMVWENGCGSGSAAVGAAEALRAGNGVTVTEVAQPGGVIRVRAAVKDGKAEQITISGRVRLGKADEVEIS